MSFDKKDYMLIKLTRGKYAKVDPWNFQRVNELKWHYISAKGREYAAHKSRDAQTGKRITLYMHSFILKAPGRTEIDHKNNYGLDNRESNLRAISHQFNLMNSPSRKSVRSTSIYKGVSFCGRNKKWLAQICKDYKKMHIGYFEEEKKAAMAYDDKAFELFGVYAYLNFPERFADKGIEAIL